MNNLNNDKLIRYAKGWDGNISKSDIRSMACEILSFRNCHEALKEEAVSIVGDATRKDIGRAAKMCSVTSVLRGLIYELHGGAIISNGCAASLLEELG